MSRFTNPITFEIQEPDIPIPLKHSYAGEVSSWRPFKLISKDFDITETTDKQSTSQQDKEEYGDSIVR